MYMFLVHFIFYVFYSKSNMIKILILCFFLSFSLFPAQPNCLCARDNPMRPTSLMRATDPTHSTFGPTLGGHGQPRPEGQGSHKSGLKHTPGPCRQSTAVSWAQKKCVHVWHCYCRLSESLQFLTSRINNWWRKFGLLWQLFSKTRLKKLDNSSQLFLLSAKKQKKRPSSYKMKYEKQSSFLKNLQKTIFY